MSLSLKIAAITLVLVLTISASLFLSQNPLEKIQATLEHNYPKVGHITGEELTALDVNDVVLFDVREPDEFKVSRLPNAILISPDADPAEFIEDYGAQIKGKNLVFYCSVGRRSSELIDRLQTDVETAEAFSLAGASFNLIGGAFAWVNAERELKDAYGQVTSKVHPYNKFWGRLINDPGKRQY